MDDRTNFNTNVENVCEFITNSKYMTVSFSQKRFITKVRELAKKFPEEVKITAENEDGSIVAHMPVSALHLSIIRKNITDEQRQAAIERLKKAKEKADGV